MLRGVKFLVHMRAINLCGLGLACLLCSRVSGLIGRIRRAAMHENCELEFMSLTIRSLSLRCG